MTPRPRGGSFSPDQIFLTSELRRNNFDLQVGPQGAAKSSDLAGKLNYLLAKNQFMALLNDVLFTRWSIQNCMNKLQPARVS
jgi:hypothetical protein